MRKILITESEKKRIIKLHNKKYLTEDAGCLCSDGSMSDECCKQTRGSITQTPVMSEEEKQEILVKAEILKRKEDEIKNLAIEQEKKVKIESIQKQLDQVYNDILNKKLDKYQKKIIDDRIKNLQNELNTLKGLPTSPSNEPQKRTADQKVNAWISVANSMIVSFGILLDRFKRQQ
jgi:hypothetical protein